MKKAKRQTKYSLRKLKVGLISVAIGTSIFLGQVSYVKAVTEWDTSGNVKLYRDSMGTYHGNVDKWFVAKSEIKEDGKKIEFELTYNTTASESMYGGEAATEEDIKKAVTGLPDKTVVEVKAGEKLPDGKTAGEYKVKAVVKYSDGSSEEVEGPVTVKEEEKTLADTTEAKNPIQNMVKQPGKISPKTGDGFIPGMYIGIVALAGGALIFLGIKQRKITNKKTNF